MEIVNILFVNIQSHEHTAFSLKPGMNFILANDNNVGKSTIFKVLTTIARAPNVPSAKLRPLMRKGCVKAYAAFDFSHQKVVAWFTLGEREAAKLFFEHTHEDGEVTRSVYCPKSLLDALGIVIGENEEVLNFNDADSVQLISQVSKEADAVITHIMLDSRVEHLKANRVMLGREIGADAKMITAQVDTSEQFIKDLHYQLEVDEFIASKQLLEAACSVCDYCLSPISSYKLLPTAEELNSCGVLLAALSSVQKFLDVSGRDECSTAPVSAIPPYVKIGISVVRLLDTIDFEVLNLSLPLKGQMAILKSTSFVCSNLLHATRSIEKLTSMQKSLVRLAVERQQVLRQIQDNSVKVICPVKGDVYYSNEECLPCSD